MQIPRLMALAVLAGMAACGTSAASGGDATADAYVGCNGDKRINLTAFPMDVASNDGALTLRFLSADPSVPLAGENTWTMSVQTASGGKADITAIAGAAFMPDHGHPSAKTPLITQQPDGTWKLQEIYLTMAGVWRITLTLKQPGGADATAVVFVCVPG